MFESHGLGPLDSPPTRSSILSRTQCRMEIQQGMSDSDGQVSGKEHGLLSNATVDDGDDSEEL